MTGSESRAGADSDGFSDSRLLVKDFDGTVALTFEKLPAGIGVNEAYEIAIEGMFGSGALHKYLSEGGLDNRAPIEIVSQLSSAAGEDLEYLTQQFIDAKLKVLMTQIGNSFPDGSLWPRPSDGYLGLAGLLRKNRENAGKVDDLVLSSGHEPFIYKTYEVWGLEPPKHVIGEDTIRRTLLDTPGISLVKPSAGLMDMARDTWRRGYGIDTVPAEASVEKSRMIYVGDDDKKDGLMARRSGVRFCLLEQQASLRTWNEVAVRLNLGSLMVEGQDEDD